ncbi:hypothetical protein [Paenimyroides baculatum]|uniref:Phage abortive infection protein n=1 Tax=Paenimyroides baculatum TaxID=2608000 RepID=A0A5M6CLX5_9FLAO|nr:hypothetical protein [Paenimyroides baculatum]KAA5534315.1 hypothetical protein F0460_09410 [Paenimyroides baculatum]
MKHKKLISIIIIVVISLFFILLFSLYYNLITNDIFKNDLTDNEKIFGSLNSLISPFVAIIAVVLTFLAFYVQYDFNIKQTKFLKNDKIDRKVDEYNKVLDSVITNDNYKDFNYNYLLSFSTTTLLSKFAKTKQLEGSFFTEIIIKEYVSTCKQNLDITKDFKSAGDLIMQYNKQIETIIVTYFKFAYLLEAFNYELSLLNIDDKEKVKLMYLFMKKFQLLYHNYDENFFFITLLYSIKLKKTEGLEALISRVIVEHFSKAKDMEVIKSFLEKVFKQRESYLI